MRLIDAESIDWTLIEEEYGARTPAVVACQSLIQNAPTIDPVRRGKWVRDETDKWRCSVCGIGNNYAYKWGVSDGYELQDKYCPNCGAKMGGDVDER